MTPGPIMFYLGPLEVRWYGVLVVTGAIVAAFIASREAARKGEDPDRVWDILLWVLPAGLIGARLYHVISAWDLYRNDLLTIVTNWRGLAIYGAVAGGLIALWVYCRVNKLRLARWMDIAAPGLILAQAIARWGNFFNQELYGLPTDLPWGLYIEPAYRYPDLANFDKFHPLFLYESLWNLLVFAFLIWIARRGAKLLDGDLICLYGIGYSTGRFFLEALRPEAWNLNGFRTAQIIALGVIAICAGVMIARRMMRRNSASAGSDAESETSPDAGPTAATPPYGRGA
jgi:phosphatidylglycerol:prolipoprotein diacylglycerol transferase